MLGPNNQIVIPATIDEALTQLAALDGLLTAKGWERAAIVAAFVEPQQGKRTDTSRSSAGSLSLAEFAALGIVGLTSDNSVRQCVDAWKATGRPRPEPGQILDSTGLGDYPPTELGGRNIKDPARRKALIEQANKDGVGQSKVLDVASNKKAVAAAVKADPETARAAAEALRVIAAEQPRSEQAKALRQAADGAHKDEVANWERKRAKEDPDRAIMEPLAEVPRLLAKVSKALAINPVMSESGRDRFSTYTGFIKQWVVSIEYLGEPVTDERLSEAIAEWSL